jgi:hypothetical protein
MIDLKYEYLFNELNEIVPVTKAIKGDKYRLNPNAPLDYIFKQGEVNTPHFSLKSNNPFYNGNNGGGGESVEHLNAKLKIAYELKYYDTIFQQWIKFDKVVPEFSHENKKRPDLSCYDKENLLVCCIEIMKTNAKTDEDLEKLKELNVPIIEININDGNKSKHLILPKELESNKREYAIIKAEEQRLEYEYNRIAEKCRAGLSEIIKGNEYLKKQIERQTDKRVEIVDRWLQRKILTIENEIYSCVEKTKQNINKIRSYTKRTQHDERQIRLLREINNVENEIKRVRELIEINAWYSDEKTDNFLWI